MSDKKNSNKLHQALIGSYSAHKKYSFQKFQKLNLSTGQPKVLSILSNKEGYLQKDLAKRCHVEPATITSILTNMVNKGLVYKETVYVSGGKKANAIYLTQKGRDMALKINKIIDDIEVISFQGFEEKEKELIIDLLVRIQSNLENNIRREQ
ncbi:MAG: MarR family transcriptional regulator [Clostridiales bacterium]|nr:MarR family transcriptional regulator [Clostridiales bacterium]